MIRNPLTAFISQLTHAAKSFPNLLIFSGVSLCLTATPVLAHHAMGNQLPVNSMQGFLSGLAHPVIGFDHFAFVVAVGLLAATRRQGVWLLFAFVLAAMLGTGLHVVSIGLPAVELAVASSVLLFGILLSRQSSPNPLVMAGLAAIAGLFHGYAYGESIFGAEMTPLLSYLVGFTVVQLGIAGVAFFVARRLLARCPEQPNAVLRSTGLVICGVGIAFLSSQVVAAIFPV